MTAVEALKDSTFSLPKNNNSDLFENFLEEMFESFKKVLDKIDEGTIASEIKIIRPNLDKFCEKIISSCRIYYSGFPAKAYFEFEEAMKFIEKFLEQGVVVGKVEGPFYRARKGNSEKFTREEMFHMPFQKREFVSTQRFSIPGLPCLYLGDSVYGCWEELRRPDKMQVAKFNLENKRIRFLDISHNAEQICTFLETTATILNNEATVDILNEISGQSLLSFDKTPLTFLVRWPLIAACSVKVQKEHGCFKPEYIFPQFLLQWVTQSNKFDGIKYASNQIRFLSINEYSKFLNYAIPVKKTKAAGHCDELVRSFSLTESVELELLKNIKVLMEHDSNDIPTDSLVTALSQFLGTQSILSQMPFEKLRE